MTDACIIVFAKAPEPGRVKTRLMPHFTPEQAADFYAAMLADVLTATVALARELRLTPVVAVHPWSARRSVVNLSPREVRLVPQRGGNLAGRMTWAIREAAAAGAARILLRGSDSPTLDATGVAEALAALDECDLVLRPDSDGGYGLLGLRRPVPELLAHAMSTRSVLDDTLANAARSGLRTHVTEPGFDIDTVADLEHLARARSFGDAEICPRTLAFLDGGALWPAGVPA